MSQVYVFDFTSFDEMEPEELKAILKDIAKKWVFQKECGEETERLHYQGRVSLKEKLRETTLAKKMKERMPKTHWSITSNTNKDNDFYVSKEETRVEGPWRDSDVVKFIPRDLIGIELRDWQITMFNLIQKEENRIVHVIYDQIGNNGKSTFVRYCGVHGYGKKIPMCNDYKDIMRMVMDMPKQKAYFIDMPRAMNKERLFQFYSAIEEVKGGYAYDDRYQFKDEYFDPPNIVIFCNSLPDRSLLSGDRWKIWGIDRGVLKDLGELSGAAL